VKRQSEKADFAPGSQGGFKDTKWDKAEKMANFRVWEMFRTRLSLISGNIQALLKHSIK